MTLELAYDGMTATVSGVEFSWDVSCWKCKDRWHVTAPGGRVRIGLHQTTRGYRWMPEENLPPRRPFASPSQCPRCGQPNGMTVNHDRPDPIPASAGPNKDLLSILDGAYRHLRETFPVQSAKADKAAGIYL